MAMHIFLFLLINALILAGLAALYSVYQQHRRKQVDYARVQLYEDADKPCTQAGPHHLCT